MIQPHKLAKAMREYLPIDLAHGHLRYEALRKLTFKQAKELWLDVDRVAPFDAIVDEFIEKEGK